MSYTNNRDGRTNMGPSNPVGLVAQSVGGSLREQSEIERLMGRLRAAIETLGAVCADTGDKFSSVLSDGGQDRKADTLVEKEVSSGLGREIREVTYQLENITGRLADINSRSML